MATPGSLTFPQRFPRNFSPLRTGGGHRISPLGDRTMYFILGLVIGIILAVTIWSAISQ